MAGKQLSRVTSQDRVLTVNDLFDPNERPHGAVMSLKETKSLVDHSTQAHIFATKAELDAFVEEQKALSEGERTVKVGDNLYITDTGVPDYWWTGEEPWISELETGAVKVEVDDALKADSANPVQNKVIKKALDNKPSYSAISALIGWDSSTLDAVSTFGDEFSERATIAFLTKEPDPTWKFRGVAFKEGEIKWVDNSGTVHTETLGGGFDPDTSSVAIGLDAVTSPCVSSIAIGQSARSLYGGVAIGHNAASPDRDSVSIGGASSDATGSLGAGSFACSVTVGAEAYGHCWSVAVGYHAASQTYGTAVGFNAHAGDGGTAIGTGAVASGGCATAIGHNVCAGGLLSVAIGGYEVSTENGYSGSIAIGSYLHNCCSSAIVIGTDCGALPLSNATIRVDYEGNLTVGGKPVGGGGDTAVEVWKSNVGFGEQDTFFGAKKTSDCDGQFLKGYPRLHNHGQDIHEVSGFSRDSYDSEDVWSHRFIIPWDLAKANDTSYMAANVVWQGNRNLLQAGDETTFVQPLVPANTGNTSSVFPYAIPAFEESPVYWSGTIIYNDSVNADGTYTDNAKMVSVPWDAMCSSETAIGGYSFLLLRRSSQPACQTTDGVTVALAYYCGGGGEVLLASQEYVRTLEERIQALEDKLAAVGA